MASTQTETRRDEGGPLAYRLRDLLKSLSIPISSYYRLPEGKRPRMFYVGTVPFVRRSDVDRWLEQLSDERSPKPFASPTLNPRKESDGTEEHTHAAPEVKPGGSDV